jgi:hypothetical protein
MKNLSELQPANTGMVLVDEPPSTSIRTVALDLRPWARVIFTYTDSVRAKREWRIGIYNLAVSLIGLAIYILDFA